MDEDLRGGGLDYCLLERYPYLLNRLLYHLGSRVAQIVPMVLGASTVALLVGGWPPIRVPGYLALCVAGFMSLLAAYALVALVACMAPLLGDVRPLQVVMSRITLLFGGVLFPLGIAPSWLAGVARYLPFRLIAYNVVNLAFNPGLHASIVVIASQSTMIITTLGLAEIMYLIGMRRT
jgi:ABC-2 type transport system permease protein